MDFEQIIQRLEWLDEQRRKDKALIAELQNRLANYEGGQKVLEGRLKVQEDSLSSLKSAESRLAQLTHALEKQRSDIQEMFNERDQRLARYQKESESRWQSQIDTLLAQISAIKSELTVIPEIQASLRNLDEIDQQQRRDLGKLEQRFKESLEAHADLQRAISAIDENRRQDIKRVADLQGEIAAVRRRMDEIREKTDLANDLAKQLDARINNLLSAEEERRRTQMEFIETQSRQQVERDRTWKEMQARFTAFSEQANAIDMQVAALQETHRAVKRALEKFDEINQKLERRIGEITEMQRLAEDRMRQDWVTFKADDQKRWTSYTLSSEAQFKEFKAEQQKMAKRLAELMDEIQNQRDLFEQTNDTTEAQLQNLMNWAHQWLEAYQNLGGRSR